MILRWAVLSLGLLILGLHFQEFASQSGLLAWRTESWWRYVGEAALLALIPVLVMLVAANDRRRQALEQALDNELVLVRQSSQQFVQQDRLLNIATQMARLGGWSSDLVAERVTFNDEACAIFDVPSGTVLTLEQAFSYFTPQFQRQVSESMDRVILEKVPMDLEVQIVTALGRYVWVRLQGHPILNERGDVVRLEGAVQDVTERKHVSSLLSQGVQRFREFANAMPHLVWTADLAGRLDYGNRILEEFLGCEHDDPLLDSVWREAIEPADQGRYNLAWDMALDQGGRLDLEIRLRRFDGCWRWHAIQAMPIKDSSGKTIKWYGSAIDVHERRDSEERAKQLAERLAVTLESITDAFFTVNTDWVFTYVNREAERLLERSRDELLGMNLWEAFPEALGTDFETYYRQAVETGIKVSFEAYFEPLDYWSSVNAYPSSDGLAVYFQDVTERRRAEEEQQRIQELERSRELAELASATKSQFLATMSHEVRTPINGIVGMVDVLHQTSLRGHQVEMVDIIRESCQSLLGIVDDILDFSKIEAGKLELAPIPFSPASLVRSVCLLLDRMALNQGVELTMYTDPALPAEVLGDELRLRQVLMNLLSNAIKFSSKLDRQGKVAVRLYVSGRSEEVVDLSFHVIDNGIGMNSATQARLFSPFSQADVSTTRQYGGTGLGLSISYSLVRAMDGDIKVSSEERKGSEFRVAIRLPIVAGVDSAPVAPDLQDARCVVWPDYQGADWSAYLRAAGALVYRPEEVPEAATHDSALWLLVCDTGLEGAGSIRWAEEVAVPVWPANYHWLMIGRGYRRRVREEGAGLFGIDSNSLSRLAFLQAAAIALGRQSQEVTEPKPEHRLGQAVVPEREQARLEGRLVLVAEDNETNQRVIRRQLAMLGFAADLCDDGHEALRRWHQVGGDYALVLTDLHMPGMDGYALTAAIRREEAEQGGTSPVPIVALTANAVIGEAERCEQLGFDDYLVKPVLLETLKTSLERWTHPSDQQPAIRRTDSGRVVLVSEALDLRVLQNLIGGDDELLSEFVESFRTSSDELVARLREAAGQGRWERVADAAHSLKSSARSVGAMALADRSLALERWGRGAEKDKSLASELLNNFEVEWRRVQTALQQVQMYLSERR